MTGQCAAAAYRPLPGNLIRRGLTGSGFQAAMVRAHAGESRSCSARLAALK
jgi:hypothetical protein